MAEMDYKAIGLRVKIARIRKGLTQEKVCELAELSSSHVSNIETGNTKVSLQTLIRIANAIGVSVDEFLCDEVKKSKHVFVEEIDRLLQDTTDEEIKIMTDVLKSLKHSLRIRLKNDEVN